MPTFIRLTEYKNSDLKEEAFFNTKNRYKSTQEDFSKIPGKSIVYWISRKVKDIFLIYKNLGSISESRQGLATGNNSRFLKLWYEISFSTIGFECENKDIADQSEYKWFPYNKGGEFRKWYGNQEYIVNWKDDGQEIKTQKELDVKNKKITANNSKCWNQSYYFKESISWTLISSTNFGARYYPTGTMFDVGAHSSFNLDLNLRYILAIFNTKSSDYFFKILNPTLNLSSGVISTLPIAFPESETIKQQIEELTQVNIDISKSEWDSRETSWDFTKNELLKHKQDGSLENALATYSTYWTEQFNTLYTNEEELNRLFIDIYGLQDELTPDVALKDITILKTEKKIVNGKLDFQNSEIIKQFISYSVGCMLGRYSLDEDGLVVANQNQDIPTAPSYEIDDDNIIPIVDESDYFSDDMTDRFTEFVRTTFGSEKLQQNIAFIETSIGKKLRAYFQKDFYIDHTKRYKKRPIYWLFTSPKGMFKVLIYMHRYTPDTLNNILNDYLRPFRIRLDSMREESMRITESESESSRDKTDADKKIDKIDKTLDDINEYEKTLAHYAAMRIEIDLDDGVKVNYCKFKELLFEFDKKLCK